jgi:hypothetical protein
VSLVLSGGSGILRCVTVDETSGYGVVPESSIGNLKTALVAWSPSLLQYVKLTVDAGGNLNTTGSGGGGGGSVTQGTTPWVTDTAKYSFRFDASASPVFYVGKAAIGSATTSAVWQIQRMDTTAGNITITWAAGAQSFNQVWDNRTGLTYS